MKRETNKAQQTRALILQAALDLFKEKGFERTTMREIAERSDLALGAAYYYFRTKEEIVLAFYIESCDEFAKRSAVITSSTKDLRKRLLGVIEERFNQLLPYRSFLLALAQAGLDPKSALSPFSTAPETAEIRKVAIKIFADLLEDCSVKLPIKLKPHLPRLLWLYLLGILTYWITDQSPEQQRAKTLNQKVLALIVRLIQLVSLPVMRSLLGPIVRLLDEFNREG